MWFLRRFCAPSDAKELGGILRSFVAERFGGIIFGDSSSFESLKESDAE